MVIFLILQMPMFNIYVPEFYDTNFEDLTSEINDKNTRFNFLYAQLICEKIYYPILKEVEILDITERGVRGFGSTGKK